MIEMEKALAEKIVQFAESIASSDYSYDYQQLFDRPKNRLIDRMIHALVNIMVNRQERELQLHQTINQLNEVKKKLEEVNVNLEFRVKERTKELQKANQLLKELSITDPLTQLNNRRSLERQLRLEIARATRYKTPLSCIMLDIDHFKKINDTYGHTFGDEVLKKLSATIQSNIRTHDFPSRYGGEEFMIVLGNTSGEKGVIVAEKLRKAVEKLEIPNNGTIVKFTISLGVAEWDETRMQNSLDFIREADEALMVAKNSGRNKTVFAGDIREKSE